jgi:DNA-binding NarL/FixJ family response regulator
MNDQRLRVFIVDDHELFRAGVRSQLQDAFEVVGEADEADAAVELILERQPDVVLLDVHLPGGGGRRVADEVHRAAPEITLLALSVSDSPEDVVSVIRAGARGYLTKTVSTEELIQAVERVAGGFAVFSPRLAGFVLEAFAGMPVGEVDAELDQLTAREREVLQHIARGYTYREIAAQLYVSPKTVETHVSKVLRKLQLSNRAELTKWAIDRRLA